MECPSCSAKNRDDAKFCKKCGDKLDFLCPICSHVNDPDSLYCDECGSNLHERKRPERVEAETESERKYVTIIFSDLSGYTAMTERLDPEEVKEIMSGIFGDIAQVITKYEGFIERFIGDAVMAIFGVPHAHEDDPIRAILAAREIHDTVKQKGQEQEIEIEIGQPLKMHTGINTGLVVTGEVNLKKGTHGVTGDAINLASRLEGLAQPGEIIVGQETYTQAKDYFNFEVLKPQKVKGKRQNIKTYRVIDRKSIKTRFEISAARGLTPLVGRNLEIERLLNSFDQMTEGHGQVISIVGEAGIGKSRLLSEFKKQISPSAHNFIIGRCLHYGENISYLPFLEILQSYLDIKEEDHEHIIIRKVNDIGKYLQTDIPPLLSLLSLIVEDENFSSLGSQQKRMKTFEALKNFILLASQKDPLILAIEDMHWIDRTSEEFIEYLLPFLGDTKILIIFLYRTEYTHRWEGLSKYQQIGLSNLTKNNSEKLLLSLLGKGKISNQLKSFMIKRASGNPLFLEEFTHSMIESGSINRGNNIDLSAAEIEGEIPSTIQGIISTRIDRLERELKNTLQTAAVIGRNFSFRILRRVLRSQGELKEKLSKLHELGFIYAGKLFPDEEYYFKHSLTQEVAYSSLLLKTRRSIHRNIAFTIEDIFGERLEEYYEMLAFHFEEGQVWDKSFVYHVKSGLKARHTYSIQTAMRHFDNAKQILSKHNPNILFRLHFDLLYGRGWTLMDMGQGKYALKEFKEAERLAKQEGESDLITQVLFSEAAAAWRGHEISKMRTILEELESIVLDNANNLLGVVVQQSWCSFGMDDLITLLSKEKKMWDLVSQAPNSKFAPEACYNIGLFHRWRGDVDKCIEVLESTLPVLKSSAKLDSFLGATFHLGLALGEKGNYQQAISILKEGQNIGLKSGEQYNIPKLTNSLGWIFHELCQYEEALEYNNIALDSIKGLLGPGTSTLFEIESQTRINLAENYLMLREHKHALDHLEVVYNNAQNPEYYLARWRWKPRCLLGLIEAWLDRRNLEKAEEYFSELTENPWLNEFPFKKYQVNTWRLQSQILMRNNQFNEAKIQIERSLSLAKQLGNPTLLWKTHQAFGKLYLKSGNVKYAKLEFANAFSIVNKIADFLTDPDLRKKYLQSGTIQNLANQAKLD